MPNSLMKRTCDVPNSRNVTEISTAAAVTIRPVRSRPTATECSLSPRLVVLLLDARQEEDLEVHRQTERDAEHEDRRRDVERPGRREVQDAGQMAVLEDPHHRAERRREAQEVQHERLHRDEQAPEHQEQQHERRHADDRERPRQCVEQRVLHVDELRGRSADDDALERRVAVADALDERFRVRRERSTDGITWNHVASAATNRADSGVGGAARTPSLNSPANESTWSTPSSFDRLAAYAAIVVAPRDRVLDVRRDDADGVDLFRREVARSVVVHLRASRPPAEARARPAVRGSRGGTERRAASRKTVDDRWRSGSAAA